LNFALPLEKIREGKICMTIRIVVLVLAVCVLAYGLQAQSPSNRFPATMDGMIMSAKQVYFIFIANVTAVGKSVRSKVVTELRAPSVESERLISASGGPALSRFFC
jgi:hypothetical protein